MSKKWQLSRRTVLRGAGALVALPVLEQMMPSLARAQAAGDVPRRLAVFYTPCGVNVARWKPAAEGPGWGLTPSLEPLAPVKGDVLVLSGLTHAPGAPDENGHHAAATAAFLTCRKVPKTDGADIQNGVSADQLVANALRGRTRFPSLELGTEKRGGVGNCDAGYACSYAQNISWAGPTTPNPKEISPRAVFDRLFGTGDTTVDAPEAAKRRAYQKSILDLVNEDAQALQKRLGVVDRRKMDEYLTGVRELERQVLMLEQLEQGGGVAACQGAVPPAGDVPDARPRVKAMVDLMVLAFKCDLTRVITFMLGDARSDRVYDFLGLSSPHHALSHHQDDPANLEALARIDRWVMEQFSYFVQQMKAVPEGAGTLLDSSLLYFSNEVADPDHHWHYDLPIVLAGRGGGAVTPGRHVRYVNKEPVANLLISLMQAMGVAVSTFGDDGTGPLHGLKV